MKTVKIAYTILLISLLVVICNSIALKEMITATIEKVNSATIENCQKALLEYEEIYEDFKKKEHFINLTVNHEDLTEVELSFAEIIGAAKANDMDSLITIKSRLQDSLEHLRRLSGINLSSIL